MNKTNCIQLGRSHLFNLPEQAPNEQAPNMSHTDKGKDEDGDLTMEDKDTSNTSFKEASARMTTRSNSQTTDTTSPVGSATDMVRRTSRHNDYQKMYEDGMAHCFASSFKVFDEKLGQSMIEAAALHGFPLAVAVCLRTGWDQNHPMQCSNGSGSVDDAACMKRAVAMFVKIEQETDGYHWAQFCLAQCYFYGYGTDQDYTKAVEWFAKASAQGNSEATSNLGHKYKNGLGCIQNYTTAFDCYTEASAQGSSGGMINLGNCYQEGQGCDQNYTKAVEWYTKASEQGDYRAMTNLAACYYKGEGCIQNHTMAFKWFTNASEQGDSTAMSNLGLCYQEGLGCDQNYTTAFKWFTKATAQGDSRAMTMLGCCYREGLGCDQNHIMAFKWYTKASEQGNSIAMNNLAVYYSNGIRCHQNYTKAVEWYTKVREQRNGDAMNNLWHNLNMCYDNGEGCDQVKCTNGHVLQDYVADGWGNCDKCGNSVSDGDNVFDCRLCNYWLCTNCYQPFANLQSHTSKRKKSEASTKYRYVQLSKN